MGSLLWLEILAICISLAYSLPTAVPSDSSTVSDALVVSSTEETSAKEVELADEENNKDVVEQSLPKIYQMDIETNVSNRYAKTLITSKVKNLAKTAQEATFAVILPETAYISGFVMEIGGKSYEAYVKEKEEAKQIYEQAVSSGLAAAHVEANARDSNRFTVSVNIEPQSKAVFKLTYEELLRRQNSQYEVVINIHPGQPVNNLNVQVHIKETRPLKFVKSPPLRSGNEISKNDEKLDPSAKIEIHNSSTASVSFTPDIEKQKEFASGLGTKEENGLSGQFVVQYDVERDPQGGEVLVKDGYFVHFFAPSDIEPLPKQVVFVLDTSGSMGGTRIRQLKEAMISILDELRNGDVFNIVEFSSTVKVWDIPEVKVLYEHGLDSWGVYGAAGTTVRPLYETTTQKINKPNEVYEVNDDNIKKAKQVVEKLNAYGGTNIDSALKIALTLVNDYQEKNKESKNQPIIIFLTDGEPTVGETYTDKIISTISELNNQKSPIFSLSFGDGADREFLQKISLQNLGFSRHIYEASDASLQLQEFYKQISSPLLSGVHFKYVSNVTRLTKTYFPIFFSGSEFVIAGETHASDHDFIAPKITGQGTTGLIDLVPVIRQPAGEGALERLWAYLTVKQILEDRDAAQNKSSYTKKALDLSLKYSFVTPVTSLVVVKPNETNKAVDTSDASQSNRPYFLDHKNFAAAGVPGAAGGAGFQPQYALGSQSSLYFASGVAGPVPEAPMSPSTYRPTIPKLDVYGEIKLQLPWLNKILLANNTLSQPEGGYVLNLIDTPKDHPECSNTPINGTASHCSLLTECKKLYSILQDENIYAKYFCPLENHTAGVCCPYY